MEQDRPSKPSFGSEPYERDWRAFLQKLFAPWLTNERGQPVGFSAFQEEFWQWVWALEKGIRPRPFIAIWGRGCAKSTSAELSVVTVAAAQKRRYALYISGTQTQANEHVQSISSQFESSALARLYPEVGQRRLSKFGFAKGWSQTRLRTASGFALDAVGLDAAMRGIKFEDQRPDFIILDDIDEELDSPGTTAKKIIAITKKIIAAGSEDLAVLGAQNLIHADSVFSRLADGRADFLADRVVSGPYPAIEGLVIDQEDEGDGTKRWVITSGTPTWEGFNMERARQNLADSGKDAFMTEYQHDVHSVDGGIFGDIVWQHVAEDDVPDLVRSVVWTDPAVTSGDESAAQGLCAMGIDANNRIFVLYSIEERMAPEEMLKQALLLAVRIGAGSVGVETDQGGDLWKGTYNTAWEQLVREGDISIQATKPRYKSAKAGTTKLSKESRAQLMRPDYQDGKIVHVINRDNTHIVAEKALRRFPKVKPLDYVDSQFWAWNDIRARFSVVIAPAGTTKTSTWLGDGQAA